MLSINSCAPAIKIYADYDKSLDIKNYKTYSWLNLNEIEGKGLNPAYYNELTDKRNELPRSRASRYLCLIYSNNLN